MTTRIPGVIVAAALVLTAACAKRPKLPPFAEKSRIEITDGDRGWTLKKVSGATDSVLASFSPGGGGMTLLGFTAGTLLVAGDTGFTYQTNIVREEYIVKCTYKFAKGSMLEMHTEGTITPNLDFIPTGTVTADFSVWEGNDRKVVSNTRIMTMAAGAVDSVSFAESSRPKELRSKTGKRLDLETMAFDLE